jgi:hypothetical protein
MGRDGVWDEDYGGFCDGDCGEGAGEADMSAWDHVRRRLPYYDMFSCPTC